MPGVINERVLDELTKRESVFVYLCVCVCERERERESDLSALG